jgi:DNA-binding transcriptional LysR family regulator
MPPDRDLRGGHLGCVESPSGQGDDLGSDVTSATGKSRIGIDPILRLSSLIMVRDAVRAGVGAGRLPVSLVSHDLAAGTLVHWGDVDGPEINLWTLYPSRRLLSARVSAFLDFLKEVFPNGTPDELASYIGG